jgi:hypothetical protein
LCEPIGGGIEVWSPIHVHAPFRMHMASHPAEDRQVKQDFREREIMKAFLLQFDGIDKLIQA